MTSPQRSRLLPIVGFFAGFIVLALVAGIFLMRGGDSQGGTSAVGGPFALVSQDGSPVTQQALKGHSNLVFFGYTHCPDVCPATLSEISSVFKALGPNAKAKAFFVTVDPRRDTPAVMKDYLESFDPHIVGLTGSPEAIRKIEDDYKVYAEAKPDKDGTYTMDHTAITYLMDKNGLFVSGFNLDRPAADAAAELKHYD